MELIKKAYLKKSEIVPKFSSNLDDIQKNAVKVALNTDISIITGGAGTGKTTVIRQIVENCDALGIKYAVTSFTGKAVARLKEIIGNNSPMTMHMMIAKRDTIEPFGHLIIDEISMVTCSLIYEFFIAFGYDYKVTFVGDENQLTPISWGNLFSQLMALMIDTQHIIPTVRLLKNYRSDVVGENGILSNANEILKYKKLLADKNPDDIIDPIRLKSYVNFCLIDKGNVETVVNVITALKDAGISAKEITVINPFNKDIDLLNKKIQAVFDLGERFILDEKRYKWRINDRVMMIENNYDIGIMNGDEGIIIDLIDPKDKIKRDQITNVYPTLGGLVFEVKKDDDKKNNNTSENQIPTEPTEIIKQATTEPKEIVKQIEPKESDNIPKLLIKFRSGIEYEFLVTYKSLDDEEIDENLYKTMLDGENYITKRRANTVAALSHAYTLTIHRSQGSEWEFGPIYFPFNSIKDANNNDRPSTFINNNMMYTAMTRYRAAVWCIGDISKITDACMQKPPLRYDTLAYMIYKLYDEYLQDLRKQLGQST